MSCKQSFCWRSKPFFGRFARIRSKPFAMGLAVFLGFSIRVIAQSPTEIQERTWDVAIWVASATGEENTSSFSEAQILSAGILAGRTITPELGTGWKCGRLEYAVDIAPVFVQFRPQHISGIAFDPIILRWKSNLQRGRLAPFMELGGGAVHTRANFPPGDTSTFNFIARGGGGIQIATTHSQALEISGRWWHISNANLGMHNPEFNGIQLSVGGHWFR